MNLTTLTCEQQNSIALIRFNRPDKANALNAAMWQELQQAMEWADLEPSVRAVVLAGQGKHFCAGIDLAMLMEVQSSIRETCEARKRENLRRLILALQTSVSSLEQCRKPVIAAIHGSCLGGGLDIALAADFRYAAANSVLGVREIDVGMVADVGSLQRLGRICGEGRAREWVLTGRDIGAHEAWQGGLVNSLYDDADSTLQAALTTAQLIASKSPLAIRGSKEILNYSRDHSVADSLNYVATWNAAMLLSEDLQKAGMALMSKQTAEFRD
ncbi:MAG TPA: crotonase/enoyl-CoA hydratase family protein [Chromobacteriaceae bacterium]|nr:crotonase/enoyl-CoA hydratase family protein [Chromobacteriaceae bacterium]